MIGTSLATVVTEAQIAANNKMTGKLNEASNKRNENLSRATNMYKGMQKDTFVVAGGLATTGAATAAVAKSETAQNVLSQSFKPIKEAIGNSKFGKGCMQLVEDVKPSIEKGIDCIKNLPKPAKVVLGIGAALTALGSTIVNAQTKIKDQQIIREHGVKEGKIQEQYK